MSALTSNEMFAALDSTLDEEPTAALPDMTGRLVTAVDALRYMTAGNATITLRGKRSRYTYKITACKDNASIFFVGLLNGPDNVSAYSYLGYIRRGVYFYGGRKAKVNASAPSAIAFEWSYRKLLTGLIPADLEIWHEGM